MRRLVLLAMLWPSMIRPQAQPAQAGPLTLVEVIELGRRQAVQATLAQLNARIADSRIGQHRSELLPFVAGGATAARQTRNLDEFGLSAPGFGGVTDPFSVLSLQLRAQQTVFDPAAFGRLRAAKDSAIAAGLDVKTAGSLAGATAGLAYLRVLSAEETVKARQADSAVAVDLLLQAKQSFEAGIIPVIDVTRNEVNLANVRTQLAVARNQRDRARLDLARAIDFPLDHPIALADSLGRWGVDLPSTAPEAVIFALSHRPELAAEEQRMKAMEQTRSALRQENLPSLVFGGTIQESGREISTLKYSYLFQLGLNVPILDGFRRQLRTTEQSLRLDAETIRIRDLRHQIEAEARQALLDLASAEDQVSLANDRLRLGELELHQAEERFKAGVAGSVETSNAQAGLIAARDALIQARVAHGSARLNTYRALGALDQLH